MKLTAIAILSKLNGHRHAMGKGMFSNVLRSALIKALTCCVLLAAGPWVFAQSVSPAQEYGRYLTPATTVTPMTAFGDQVSLRDGLLSFRQVDVELPGIGPTIRIARSFRVVDRSGTYDDTSGNRMGEWELSLPRLKTLTSSKAFAVSNTSPRGWQVGMASNARCTQFDSPGTIFPVKADPIEPETWWAGYQLVEDSGETESVLQHSPDISQPAHVARTKNNWLIACLPSTSNGQPGEAFQAIAPDGTRYWLDYLVYNAAPGVGESGPGFLGRNYASMLVTRVQDRFGNWVTYHYTAGILDAIDASDGRHVSLTSTGNDINSVTVWSASGNRTWQYQYGTGGLAAVVLPDGSSWQYSLGGLVTIGMLAQIQNGGNCNGQPSDGLSGTVRSGTVTAPSGATAMYSVRVLHVGRSYVQKACWSYTSGSALYAEVPKDSWSYAITSKTISGPGISQATWNYNYSPGYSSWISDCGGGCTASVWTDVTDPDGTRHRSIFSNKYGETENLLLRNETYAAGSGALMYSSDYVYATYPWGPSPNPYPWPADLGLDLTPRVNQAISVHWAPILSTAVTQDGVTFSSQVNTGCSGGYCYDAYARPLSVHKWSSLGYGRNDVTEYYDDTTHWVLGQIGRHYNVESGLVDVRNVYDSTTALPLQTYAFEKLKATMTYYADGTLATSKDGNNNVTTFSNWKRGIPQNIQYADGTGVSAIVNDNGWVTAVTDENGYATGYGYDAMGRVAAITYPNETNLNYNNTTITFAPTTTSAYGLPAGYWQQVTTTGNRKKVVYFDGLWRPVVEESYDTGNVAATLSQTFRRYDAMGRVTFQSLPQRTQDANVYNTWGNPAVTPNATGIKTVYDALGRVTQAQQDSELGALTTTTEYLTGFQVRTTNPRGYKTTNGYEVYDQPSYDKLAWSAQPENKDVTITRNYFGLPLTITQSDHTNTAVSVTRQYLYNPSMELCRTIEPEVSNTFMGYDAAGNLSWSATGYPTTTVPACTDSASVAANRIDRSYDARNRLLTLSFPDGVGNQSWQYTPDGLASQITTYNEVNNGAPVVNAYHYNKRRLLDGNGESVSQDGWYTWAIGHGYDANASLTTEVYPGSEQVSYAPNALGQPTQVTSPYFTYATGVSYYPNGGISQFTYGNGIVHTMTQNARQLPARSTDAGVINYGFTYDGNANPTAISDDQQGAGYNRVMTYDGLDRLTTAQSGVFGGTDQTHRFSYDALDNLKSWKLAGVKDYASYIYDASNRLTQVNTTAGTAAFTLTYDVRGNLASKGSQSYYFDYGNRLRWATGQESYRYDGFGRRVTSYNPSSVPIMSMYDAGGVLRYQRDLRQNKVLNYMYLGGSLVAYRETTLADMVSVAKYQHTDALGSPVAITNQAGQVIERTSYEPYGSVIGKPNNDRPGYTGHVMDSATGLTYMQQRYYDPTIGRFLSTDPVAADANKGVGFNRYWYADNNPYKFTDPDGRQSCGSACSPQMVVAQLERATQWMKAKVDSVIRNHLSLTAKGTISAGTGITATKTLVGNQPDKVGWVPVGQGAYAGTAVDIKIISVDLFNGAKETPFSFEASGDLGALASMGGSVSLDPGGKFELGISPGLGVGEHTSFSATLNVNVNKKDPPPPPPPPPPTKEHQETTKP